MVAAMSSCNDTSNKWAISPASTAAEGFKSSCNASPPGLLIGAARSPICSTKSGTSGGKESCNAGRPRGRPRAHGALGTRRTPGLHALHLFLAPEVARVLRFSQPRRLTRRLTRAPASGRRAIPLAPGTARFREKQVMTTQALALTALRHGRPRHPSSRPPTLTAHVAHHELGRRRKRA